MRFSVFFPLDYYEPVHPSRHDYLVQLSDLIRLVEDLGFAGAWFTENHLDQENGLCPDPALLIAHAASLTKHLRLGSAVSVAPLQHPLHLVERYAFLDHLTNGRVDLGLGSGYFQPIFEAFAVPYEQRQDLRDHAISYIKQHWLIHEFEDSAHKSPPRLLAQTLQQPHPPLWISAVALDRVVAILESGDSVLIDPLFAWFGFDELKVALARLKRGNKNCRHVGLLMYTSFGYDDDSFGYFDKFLGKYAQANQNKSSVEFWHTHQSHGSLLCCSPETAIERLTRVQAVGVDQVLLGVGFGGMPLTDVVDTLKTFSLKVLPVFA